LKLLVATRSRHKLREIRRILADVRTLELVGPDDVGLAALPEEEVLEPFETFEENARSKAHYFHARSGLPTVADDSGLEVDALGGAPGVRSKRFAPVGEGTPDDERDLANNAHLLELLRGRPAEGRTARYVCVVVLDEGAGDPLTLRGESVGAIAEKPSGAGGFGYDPLFLDGASGKTFAQLSPDEKNARSHRGAAFRKLAEVLRSRVSR
jgi:XTP/dITP diphosphohydrolase